MENQINIYQYLELVKKYWKKARWYLPICIGLGILLGGFLYYKKSKEVVSYYGESTFMLSSDDMGSGGGIAESLGVMLPGSNRTGNKNILLELLKSHKMIENTLMTKAQVNGDSNLLINHFIELSGYRESWQGNKEWENYEYPQGYQINENELRDGFLRASAKQLSYNYNAKITDGGIFKVSFFFHNQDFTKSFLDNLMKTIIAYYTEKKTAKASNVYKYAKERYDKLYADLNGKQRQLARTQDRSSAFVFREDLTPQFKISSDIEATTELLGEATKSLEAAKMSLVQETPFIQVIDDVRLPLSQIEPEKVKYGIIGLLAGIIIPFVLIVGFIIAREYMQTQKSLYYKN